MCCERNHRTGYCGCQEKSVARREIFTEKGENCQLSSKEWQQPVLGEGLCASVSMQTCLKELQHPLVSVPESLGGESVPLRRVNVHVTFQFCLRAQLRKLKRVVHRNIRVFPPVEDE